MISLSVPFLEIISPSYLNFTVYSIVPDPVSKAFFEKILILVIIWVYNGYQYSIISISIMVITIIILYNQIYNHNLHGLLEMEKNKFPNVFSRYITKIPEVKLYRGV